MKKIILYIFSISILASNSYAANISMVCGGNAVKIDKRYIYQYFGSGAVDKYKITNKGPGYVSGFLKGKNLDYDVSVNLSSQTLTVNKKDRKTGITGSYTKNCY
jgi:hypothetical protein